MAIKERRKRSELDERMLMDTVIGAKGSTAVDRRLQRVIRLAFGIY